MIFFIISTNAISQIPTNGLIGWYPFNGNADDMSGNGRHGTVYGATLTSDRFGVPNSAYSFNGLSNYISLPNVAVQGAGNRTISFWIKTNASIHGSMVVSTGTDANINGGAFNLRLENSNRYIGFMGGNFTLGGYDYYPTGNIVLNDNTWHNVIVTYNGTTINFYIDGVFEKSTNKNLSTNGQANFIGKSNHIGQEAWYVGEIDDVCFWNRVLTPSEIAAVYNAQSVLPLKWGNFVGVQNNGNISLFWETLQEQNTADFTIQHSREGTSWVSVGKVKAATNSNGLRKYSFIHKTPNYGRNFYRIMQSDINGANTFSKTITVKFDYKSSPSFSVTGFSPNGVLSITMFRSAQVYWYTNSGLLLWTKFYSAGIHHINIGNTAKGIYYIKVDNESKPVIVN
jgi:hypothetical protein